jgi:gag-polypeptide of LTR copia-type/Pol polyprotein, beta-barrel domain/Zinc knuckle
MSTPQLDYITTTGNGFSTFLKLNSTNFYSWKNNMETVLYGLNQMVMIQGTLPRPRALKPEEPTTAEFAAMVAWDLCAGRAYMELALHIEDKWKQPIMGHHDPVKAWKSLEDTYGASLDGMRAVLFTQITTMKYTTGPIQMHQLKMEKVQQKLTAAGQSISDSQFLSYFLNSLPAELDQFTTTVNHTTETVASVAMRLRQMKLHHKLRGEGSEGVGLFAKAKGSTGKTKRRGKCHNCDEAGHWAHECKKPKKKRSNSSALQQANPQAPVGHMFMALNGDAANYGGVTTYILDSGASNHYTPSQDDLQDYIPFSTPRAINTTKGQVQAMGTGTLHYMLRLKNGEDVLGELCDMTWVPDITA